MQVYKQGESENKNSLQKEQDANKPQRAMNQKEENRNNKRTLNLYSSSDEEPMRDDDEREEEKTKEIGEKSKRARKSSSQEDKENKGEDEMEIEVTPLPSSQKGVRSMVGDEVPMEALNSPTETSTQKVKDGEKEKYQTEKEKIYRKIEREVAAFDFMELGEKTRMTSISQPDLTKILRKGNKRCEIRESYEQKIEGYDPNNPFWTEEEKRQSLSSLERSTWRKKHESQLELELNRKLNNLKMTAQSGSQEQSSRSCSQERKKESCKKENIRNIESQKEDTHS